MSMIPGDEGAAAGDGGKEAEWTEQQEEEATTVERGAYKTIADSRWEGREPHGEQVCPVSGDSPKKKLSRGYNESQQLCHQTVQ